MLLKLQNQLSRIEQELTMLTALLKKAPQGDLVCTYNGPDHKYTRWYVHTENGTQYLPHSQRALAKALAEKKYASLRIEELKALRVQITQLLQLLMTSSPADQLLLDDRYSGLFPSAKDDFIHAWQNENYQRNPFHPEHLIHHTSAGYMVRSKSESIISQALSKYQIPHRYECALALGDHVVFPDFTILHPETKKIFYWEHYGMIDHPNYQIQAIRKISEYMQEGICPNEQLLLTFESSNMPLDASLVDKIIEDTFL